MSDLHPHQVAILVLAFWLAIALALQLPPLIRFARDGVDWEVVGFRASLTFLAVLVVLQYVFEVNPWLLVVGWLVLDLTASANTLYIRRRAREDKRPLVPND